MARKIALAVVAVVVLVAALALVRRREAHDQRKQRAEGQLPSFDDRAVTALVFETPGSAWRLVRRPPGWRIASPVDDAADPRAVEALIAAMRRTPIEQSIDAPEAAAFYGLDPPRARITLEGVQAPVLEIGHVAPTGEGLFARLGGRTGVLVLRLPDAAPLQSAGPPTLRDRSLVDLSRSEIVGIDVARYGLRLARGADGWWIEAPRRLPASGARIDKFLGALFATTVTGWDDTGSPSDGKYGLGADGPRVTLRTASAAQTITLGAGAEGDGRYATASGRSTILIAGHAPPPPWPHDIESFREPRLTNINRYAVTRVVYAVGDARFAATRKDDTTWTMDTGAPIRADGVYTLLVGLLEAETTAWTAGALPGKPSATLEFVTDKGAAGRLSFAGTRATWDALPGVVFQLGSPLPPVPQGAAAQ